MTIKIPNPENDAEEIEVYTAAEVTQRETDAAAKKEAEFAPIKTELETKLGDAKKALNERAGEFAQFRKLSDEQVEKLSVAERTIYENGLALADANKRVADGEKARLDAAVETSLRTKAGKDDKLFQKMKDTWSLINVEAITPEQIEQKTMMVLGAISTTAPDLVASVAGFGGGSFEPPKEKKIGDGESFADTERGKTGAAELGLLTEAPKQK